MGETGEIEPNRAGALKLLLAFTAKVDQLTRVAGQVTAPEYSGAAVRALKNGKDGLSPKEIVAKLVALQAGVQKFVEGVLRPAAPKVENGRLAAVVEGGHDYFASEARFQAVMVLARAAGNPLTEEDILREIGPTPSAVAALASSLASANADLGLLDLRVDTVTVEKPSKPGEPPQKVKAYILKET